MELLESKRICITAYHPGANGFIEWFHCQLKTSLKAQLQPTLWVDVLPLVLLGIRTTLCLPGEFFNSNPSLSFADPAGYVTQLNAIMAKLKAPPVRKQSPKKLYLNNDLSSYTHVYIRHEGTRKPLQRPYEDPYKALKWDDKQVEVKGRQDTLSLDRLKPAHLEPSLTATTTPTECTEPFSPPVSTPSQGNPVPTSVTIRSGRRVHWPKRYL